MRVALYSGTFKKDQDGVAKTIYRLVDLLVRNRTKLSVWAPSVTEGVDKGYSLHRVPSVSLPLYRDYRIGIPIKIRRELDRFGPKIIHITTPDLVGLAFLRYARKKGIHVVTSYHSDFSSYLEYYHLTPLRGPMWRYFRWFYNSCNVTFAPTEKVKSELEKNGIGNVEIWSRGIDPLQFDPSRRSMSLRKKWGMEKKKIILYSGRFVWYKDIDVFTGVYKELKRRYKERVGFVLLGSGPRDKDLRKAMPDAVFPGYLTGEDLYNVYASADIFLFPSTTETFGNVVLEAIASGVPSVVSDIGGCREVVEKTGGGMIARAKDITSFFNAICILIDNEDAYRRTRSKGIESCSKMDWDTVNGKVLSRYNDLLSQKYVK